MIHVFHQYLKDVIRTLPGDQITGLHLREGLYLLFKVLEPFRRVFIHGNMNQGIHLQPELIVVDQGDILINLAVLF